MDTMIALGALLVSLLSLLIAWRSSKKSSRIERLHQTQANLSARLDREVAHAGRILFYLVIDNRGEAEAQNIRVNIDGNTILKSPVIPDNVEEITQIGPKSFFRYPMAITMGESPPYDIKITWEDNSGKPGYYTSKMTL